MSLKPLNGTLVEEFLLLGLTEDSSLQRILFPVFLAVYLLNLTGNLSIMGIVISACNLHTPMYFFLCNLSVLDICYSSVSVPKLLHSFLTQQRGISAWACLTQMHFFHLVGSSEALLVAVMSYDRYAAICKPLHYSTMMKKRTCVLLALGSWLGGFMHSLLHTLFTVQLPFCGSNRVNHFFCDIKPLLKLACADTTLNMYILALGAGSLVLVTFLLIVLSYIFIGSALLRIRSSAARLRAFSTCVSHLLVVILLYGTAFFTYARPANEESLYIDRSATIIFSVVTPMLNPFIYSLRNQDVHRATKRLLRIPG
ncbi:olfactory receptor 12D1-like [Hyperolius riggenbachi]|uniref:olfactory receptor 12D1-like n=1 Tax=Hyperolius riggenbachi TaxID=752182 RepID=UPI0035A3257E